MACRQEKIACDNLQQENFTTVTKRETIKSTGRVSFVIQDGTEQLLIFVLFRSGVSGFSIGPSFRCVVGRTGSR